MTDDMREPRLEPVSDEELSRQIGAILSMSADMDGDVILRCLTELQQRRRPTPKPTQPEGHGKPCHYCGEPCDALIGNPNRWPIPLCHRDDPGRVKWHHIGCVTDRLVENQAEPTGGDVGEALAYARKFITGTRDDSGNKRELLKAIDAALQSLASGRDAVIEECAKVCDELIEDAKTKQTRRGLKDDYGAAWIDALNHAAGLIRLRALKSSQPMNRSER